MTDFKNSTILVTGASGKLGRRIVELLIEGGTTKVIAGTRDPSRFSLAGVETRRVDFSDAASLPAAFAGVDQLLIVSTDVIGPVRQKLQLAAVEAAKAAGVKHIVYTSLTHPGPDSPVLLAPDHDLTEKAIADTGIDYTILRNAVYMDSLLASLPPALDSGNWYTIAGEGRIAYVTREDCAQAAAGTLLGGPKGKRILDIAGPDLLTTTEVAAIATAVLGKPINVVQVSEEQLVAGMVGAGLPQPVAALLASFEKATQLGHAAVTSQVVEVTDHPLTGIRAFLEANRSALVG